MNREERVRILIDYLKKENTGYASLADIPGEEDF